MELRGCLLLFLVLGGVAAMTGRAFGEPTFESSTQHCTDTNRFDSEKHRDLYEHSLRACSKEENTAREKIAGILKDATVARFARRCDRHVSYAKQLWCIERYQEEKDKEDARTAFVMGLEPKNEDVPRVDVDATCRRRSQNDGQTAYQECMAKQQAAYDYLKPLWPRLPKETSLQCRWMLFEMPDGTRQINPDYPFVKGCVEREVDQVMRKKHIDSVPFRY